MTSPSASDINLKSSDTISQKAELSKNLKRFHSADFPQGATLRLDTMPQEPEPLSDSSQSLPACEYGVDFEIDLIEFSGDGMFLAFCGDWSDIHICRLRWTRAVNDSASQTWVKMQPLVNLPTTTLKVRGFSWGPVDTDRWYPRMVSWDDDSVTLWSIINDEGGDFVQMFDYPVEDVISASMASDVNRDEVIVWTLTDVLILVPAL